MATPRAKQFLQTLSTDVALRQKLENATTPDERRQIIDGAGYSDLSKEDLRQAAAEVGASAELSDAELEAVAGGGKASWVIAVSTVVSAVTVLAATD
jgi:predicted ribosomally synthesized peptide with nif11-like leader